MPEFVVEKTLRLLSDRSKGLRGSRILALGVAYKKDIDDPRESPAGEVIKLLEERHATVIYHDPHVPRFTEFGLDLQSVPLTVAEVKKADMVLLLTDHTGVDYDMVVREAVQLLDTRNATKRVNGDKSNVVLL
jgi:UDP-N-acetyl-D-glucosamine dehydrogenase